MCRPRARIPDIRRYIIAIARYLQERLPHRKTWSNQKISDAELIAVGLARIRFRQRPPLFPEISAQS